MQELPRTSRTIRRLPSWRALDSVGNSRLATLTILVPIIGYMILFNEQIVEYFYLSRKYVWGEDQIINQQTASYRIFFIYFGLSFVGLGSLLFQIVCPRTIKGNRDLVQYVEKESKMGSAVRFKHLREEIGDEYKEKYADSKTLSRYMRSLLEFLSTFDSKPQGVMDYQDVTFRSEDRHVSRHEIAGTMISDHEVDNETLKVHYFLANIRFIPVRFAISLLYFLGLLLLSVPTLDTFARVAFSMWSQFFAVS